MAAATQIHTSVPLSSSPDALILTYQESCISAAVAIPCDYSVIKVIGNYVVYILYIYNNHD